MHRVLLFGCRVRLLMVRMNRAVIRTATRTGARPPCQHDLRRVHGQRGQQTDKAAQRPHPNESRGHHSYNHDNAKWPLLFRELHIRSDALALTCRVPASQTFRMHNSFLVFDFGADEAAAQLARHKLDGWKQAFRLDKKLLYKFEREPGPEPAAPAKAAEVAEAERPAKSAKGKGKSAAKPTAKAKAPEAASAPADGTAPPSSDIKLIVRLYFSGHERLSYQRWVGRIPGEEPFKTARLQSVRQNDAGFGDMDQKFEALE